MSRWRLLGLVVPALWTGCRAEPPDPSWLDFFLANSAVAQKEWDGVLIELGTPAARPHLGEGWSYEETAPDGNPFRWAVGEHAEFQFSSRDAGRRLAWIECEPHVHPDSPVQILQVTANGEALPSLSLREGRGRYPLEMPVLEGTNHVDLQFSHASAPMEPRGAPGDRRPLAVAFFRFELPSAATSSSAGPVGPFSLVKPAEGPAGIYIPARGGLSFFIEIPEKSRIDVTAGAREPEWLLVPRGGSLGVRVTTEDGQSLTARREAERPKGDVFDLTLDLGPLAGRLAQVVFEASGQDLLVSPRLLIPKRAESESYHSGARVSNVVMILLDGASAQRMSAYGFDRPTTPEIERLSQESVVFDSAISQAVYTIASMGSLWTGQYPERHQSVSFADRLADSAVTLPERLRSAGVLTVGFSGNAVVSSAFGLNQGFEAFEAVWESEDYTGHGDSVLRSFLGWLDTHGGQRFFAYVHFREPHFPYNPPPPYDARFGPSLPFPQGIRDWGEVEALNHQAARGEEVSPEIIARIRGLYDGNLAYVDTLVGGILEALDSRGLAGKTAVMVMADHGEALFDHRYIGHNVQLYEESIRVPLLIRLPGLTPRRVPDVVELVDVAPTVLDLLGLGDQARSADFQGRGLVSLLDGGSLPGRLAFSRTLWDKPRYAARGGRYKWIWDSRTGESELYDLVSDPAERVNRIADPLWAGGFLRQELHRWLREQAHLRSGGLEPAVVPEEILKQLRSLGYTEYVEGKTR